MRRDWQEHSAVSAVQGKGELLRSTKVQGPVRSRSRPPRMSQNQASWRDAERVAGGEPRRGAAPGEARQIVRAAAGATEVICLQRLSVAAGARFLLRPLPRAVLCLPGATVSSPSRAGIEGRSPGARVLRQARRTRPWHLFDRAQKSRPVLQIRRCRRVRAWQELGTARQFLGRVIYYD